MADASEVLSKFQLIQITEIKPSRHQARKQFDEESLKGLAESIKEEGLQQPVTVRLVDGGYELVSGERRLRATKLLGESTILAHIVDVPSEASAAAKGLVENLQRQDLNPIEEAEGFKELNGLDSTHWTHEQIAKVTGKGRTYITESLRLLTLPSEVQQNVGCPTLSRSHGIELLRLNNANSIKGMANKIIKGGWSVKKTKETIDRKLKGPGAGGPADIPPSPTTRFKFASKGTLVIMTAAFETTGGNLDSFLMELRGAYAAWNAKSVVGGNVVSDTPTTEHVSRTTSASTPAESEAELAELEALGKDGPGPIYAKLAPWFPLAEMMEGSTWADFGAKDAKEGLPQLLAALKMGKEKGL